MTDSKRLSNHISADVDCRYHHTSEELKLVSKLLDVLNEAHDQLLVDYGFEGSLDVYWVDTIAGRIESVPDHGWFYFPTSRDEAPERGNA